MPRVQAWERLNDMEYCSMLNMAQFHQLLLDAGYDARTAQRLANERGWERLTAGVDL